MNTTIHVDRLRRQLDQMRAAGYELGTELAVHLDITDLLGLPDQLDALVGLLGRPFDTDFLADLVDPDGDWSEWSEDVLPEGGVWGPIAHNHAFWVDLYLAVEAHVLAGADEVEINDDGTLEVLADRTTGCRYQRPPRPAEHRDGSACVGQIYLSTNSLPPAYVSGVARALLDLRVAVHEATG